MHKKTTAAEQNAFLMKYINAYAPARRRPRKESTTRKPRVNAQYLLRKVDGTMLIVCAATFCGVTGVGK